MEQIFISLREIIVLAIPAFVLVLLLHFYLKRVLFQPMEQVMEERRRRTEGALAGSEDAVRTAEERLHEYEHKLNAARAAIYEETEATRKQMADQQSAALAEARTAASGRVAEARAVIAAEAAEARTSLAAEAERIAARMADRILTGRVQ
jgi:F-type H+-transporting ATPase subunit b